MSSRVNVSCRLFSSISLVLSRVGDQVKKVRLSHLFQTRRPTVDDLEFSEYSNLTVCEIFNVSMQERLNLSPLYQRCGLG